MIRTRTKKTARKQIGECSSRRFDVTQFGEPTNDSTWFVNDEVVWEISHQEQKQKKNQLVVE